MKVGINGRDVKMDRFSNRGVSYCNPKKQHFTEDEDYPWPNEDTANRDDIPEPYLHKKYDN